MDRVDQAYGVAVGHGEVALAIERMFEPRQHRGEGDGSSENSSRPDTCSRSESSLAPSRAARGGMGTSPHFVFGLDLNPAYAGCHVYESRKLPITEHGVTMPRTL